MRFIGDIELAGLGTIINLRAEVRADDPSSPAAGQIWYNTALGQYRTYDGTTISSVALSSDLDTIKTGTGLSAEGTYVSVPAANYIGGVSSVHAATVALDAALKSLADTVAEGGDAAALAEELNATQAGAGLSSDGDYVAYTDSNYLNTATSLHSADRLLDTALKSARDVADGAASAVITAQAAADAAAGAAADAQTAIDGVSVVANGALQRTGGSMAGDIAMGNNKITGIANGVLATDAVNKGQLDAAISGLDFQADVLGVQTDATLIPELTDGARYVITAPGSLATEFGTIEDLGAGDIVEYDGSEFVVVYDVSLQGEGAITWNRADNSFWYYNTSWAAFGGMSGVEAGVGLRKTGNTLSVELGAGIGQLPTNEVGLDLLGTGGLFLTVDGTEASTASAAQLSLRLDGTSLSKSSTGVKIANAGVTADHIAAAALGLGLAGGAGTSLSVKRKASGGILADVDGVYIDQTVLQFLPLAGGTLTGPLILNADPTNALGAATKQMVDAVSTAATNAQSSVTALTTRVAAGHVVYNGSAVSSVTHNVAHNIGQRFVNVQVVDAAGEVVIPDSITLVDANNLTVTFASAMTCWVSVVGVKAAA